MNKTNTKKYGLARIFVFPEKNKYIAVCLDLDIIEEAATREDVLTQITEAVVGYVENAVKNNLDDKVLNRPAPKKYWELSEKYLKWISTKKDKGVRVPDKIKNSSFCSFPIKDCPNFTAPCLN
jgi:predicted RNase H-like HicB family nuclease